MFEILAFGDSLTRGADPGGHRRHPVADRWPNVLAEGLEGSAHVISEGLGGRTTIFDDGTPGVDRNGAHILPTLLATHGPLDLVILMLGSNDLKPSVAGTAEGAARGIEVLASIVADSGTCLRTLIVSPPHFVASPNHGDAPRAGRSVAESRRLAPLLKALAERREIGFFDASTVARASTVDGVHLDRDNTRAIGTALTPVVRKLLAQPPHHPLG